MVSWLARAIASVVNNVFTLQFIGVCITLVLHAYCYFHVPVGWCEVKYRRLRFGRKKYGLLEAGTALCLPFIHKRMFGARGEVGLQFPVVEGAQALLTP